MPRLFSALELADPVVEHLGSRLVSLHGRSARLRWIPPRRWHLTLGFYGDHDDPERRGAWLRARLAARTDPAMPSLRLAGAGRFPGVLWVGVEPDGAVAERGLREIAELARPEGDLLEFRPHVTVARWRGRRTDRGIAEVAAALADYAGPWWMPAGLTLFRSTQTAEGPRYEAVERFSGS